MTLNPQLQPQKSLSSVSAAVCNNCNSDHHWILHNDVRGRGDYRKLCTSCVLKLHPTSFCPTCFNLHDPCSLNPLPPLSSSSSNNRTLTCLKCNSISHITCVPPNTPKSPYLCPPCSNPSFKFFDFKKPRKFPDQPQSDSSGGGGGGDSKKVLEEHQQFLDERAAKVLLLAANISAITMNKAVASSRSDVERKVKDAALAKKRAKEAIEHVITISSKLNNVKHHQQQQRRDVLVPGPGSSSGPGQNYTPVKIERNGGAHNVGVSGNDNNACNGNGTVAMAAGAVVQSNGGKHHGAE